MKRFLSIAFAIAVLPAVGGAVLTVAATAARTNPVYVEVQEGTATAAARRERLYSRSYALVIGIDNYTGGWPRLSNAVKDADIVAAKLDEIGFTVSRLIDPTGTQLREALRRFFAITGAEPEARLFVWYAGHGHTDNGEGYLVGADAPLPDRPEFLLQALHMRDVGSMVRLARAKHALAVFDSCFSGTIFSAQRSRPPAAISRATLEPVRQFLTSGDADQLVSDDGTFRKLFVAALEGREPADFNRDGYLTGSELGLYIEDRLTNLTEGAQTPRSGKLRDIRFDRGDFVFVLPTARRVARADSGDADRPSALSPDEQAFWDSVKQSVVPAEYEAYLRAYPRGFFAPLAEARLQTLRETITARTAAPPPATQTPRQAEPRETTEIARLAVPNPTANATPSTALNRALRTDSAALARALLEYGADNRMFVLPNGRPDEARITLTKTRIVSAAQNRALAEVAFSVRTSWGRTLVSDYFALAVEDGRISVLAHGDRARQ